jgi:hypothetical protein
MVLNQLNTGKIFTSVLPSREAHVSDFTNDNFGGDWDIT